MMMTLCFSFVILTLHLGQIVNFMSKYLELVSSKFRSNAFASFIGAMTTVWLAHYFVGDYTEPLVYVCPGNNKSPCIGGERYQNDNERLGRFLRALHESASAGNLKFSTIYANRTRCPEIHNLYHLLLDKELKTIDLLKPAKLDRSALNTDALETAISEYGFITRKMCRRAMARNKFYGEWVSAVLKDEMLLANGLPIMLSIIGLARLVTK